MKAVISTWDANDGWLRVLAPYVAVAVGWLWLGNAWFAIGGYHVLILLLLWKAHGRERSRLPHVDSGATKVDVLSDAKPGGGLLSGGTPLQLAGLVGGLVAVSAAFVGFSDYIVVPTLDIPTWLAERGLGKNHLLFAAYYALIHPFLEDLAYRPLRQASGEPWWRRRALELGFAGYHMLVVGGFLRIPVLVSLFVGLWGVMAFWRWLDARTGGGRLPLAFHIVADIAVSACVVRWMS